MRSHRAEAGHQKSRAMSDEGDVKNLNAQGKGTVLLLAMMMFMAPAMGVPSEEMLQDTLKSLVISFFTLTACFTYFWRQRNQDASVLWHPILWLPTGLTLYALGSMTWSHSYLAGVETIRWFIFSLILWLGTNSLTYERVPRLALGIHLGATVASIWTALQFWIDFKYFPQGPNPSSTFVNRNFFAEFVVCTLPFSIYLLTREKKNRWILALTFSTALNVTALMMSGTRSALIGLLMLILVVTAILTLYRGQLESSKWEICKRVVIPGLLVFTTLGLGSIPTNNAQLIAEYGGGSALDRALSRTKSMTKSTEYTEGSFSIRAAMWKVTGQMIQAHPLAGVGAGAWEVQAPIYQSPGSQLETDFYAHNEILQLLAEYGLIGWAFLLSLIAYLVVAALRTLTNRTVEGKREAPLRLLTLSSLLVLLLVSNAGFPWRLATTGALFALCLAVLSASDTRLGLWKTQGGARPIVWKRNYSKVALWATTCSMTVAMWIAQQAIESESKLVRAIKIALTISKSGQPNHPQWQTAKAEMIQLMRDGIKINPHYRKLTPMAADELANWGDWENAIWIWDSVLASRPNIVAVAANISRGYLQIGDYQRSLEYLAHAAKLQPTAPAVRSLQVIFLTRTSKYSEAKDVIKELFQTGVVDYDLVYTAYLIGTRTKDWELAIQALHMRIKKWPHEAYDGWLKLGDIYNKAEVGDASKALDSYAQAVKTAPDQFKEAIRGKIPQAYQSRLEEALKQ